MRHIFCVGMYRACSTWQYEILSQLVVNRLEGRRLGFLDGDDFDRIRRAPTPDGSPSILKSHDAHAVFADELAAGRAVGVYASRDLRDVVFSFLHKARLEFDDLIRQRFIQKVIRNDTFWRTRPGILAQRFEDIQRDPVAQIQQLSRHVGIMLSLTEAVALADEFSWEANFRRTQQIRGKAEAAGLDLSDRANTNRQDPVTLLHWNHLRADRGASWRDLATASQRETLAYFCGAWLIENGYETDARWVAAPWEEPEAAKPLRVVEATDLRSVRATSAPSVRRWGRMLGLARRG